MTAQYPPPSGDGPDAPGLSAADLSYADVASPPQATDAYVPAERVPAAPETSERPAAGRVRAYSWPSASPLAPAESSEVDSVDLAAVGSDAEVESVADDSVSTVDQVVAVSEVEPGPSIVDDIESGPGETDDESPPAAELVDTQAEPVAAQAEPAAPPDEATAEPTDPAVAQLRAVSGRLSELDGLPIEEHPARYEELHAELTGALAQIDRGPDSQA